jgi:hypothetical protein
MVSTEAIEGRLSAVEKELAELKSLMSSKKSKAAWWEEMFGSFADSEGFDEAVWLGKEYRDSLRVARVTPLVE